MPVIGEHSERGGFPQLSSPKLEMKDRGAAKLVL